MYTHVIALSEADSLHVVHNTEPLHEDTAIKMLVFDGSKAFQVRTLNECLTLQEFTDAVKQALADGELGYVMFDIDSAEETEAVYSRSADAFILDYLLPDLRNHKHWHIDGNKATAYWPK